MSDLGHHLSNYAPTSLYIYSFADLLSLHNNSNITIYPEPRYLYTDQKKESGH
jgi:hypothetical protein